MPNPFETLGFTPTFAIDAPELEQRQRDLNRAMHPDRHAGKSPAQRRQALTRAMDINQACRTLRDPIARAEALLGLIGADTLSGRTLTDPALLGEMLEQRELLDEVRRNRDVERLHALKTGMVGRERKIVLDLERAFEPLIAHGVSADHADTASQQVELEEARRLLTELKYVRRFGEEVAAIEDEI